MPVYQWGVWSVLRSVTCRWSEQRTSADWQQSRHQQALQDCLWASSQLAIHRHQGDWHHKVTNSSCVSTLLWSTDRPASHATIWDTVKWFCLPWLLRCKIFVGNVLQCLGQSLENMLNRFMTPNRESSSRRSTYFLPFVVSLQVTSSPDPRPKSSLLPIATCDQRLKDGAYLQTITIPLSLWPSMNTLNKLGMVIKQHVCKNVTLILMIK